ncbi:beta-lactamase family protein [Myxococcota bacterium]|nr:beta-lactamase family protein [Myxococcota bacterium]
MQRVEPEEVGLSRDRLQRIDDHLRDRYIVPGKISGALTLVARHGHVAHCSPLGHMEIEGRRPLEDDAIFRIYSMTKPITSVAVMMLYERGLFQLRDPVHRYIPAFREQGVFRMGSYRQFLTDRPERPMRIKDLLMHTSGLTYGFMHRTNVDAAYRKAGLDGVRTHASLDEMIETLASLPLEFSPGQAWNYSMSTDVLGYLVQVVSGKPFDQFLREEIFEPLGMPDTGFFVPPEKQARFPACYERRLDKKLLLQDDPDTSPYLEPPRCPSGGGGLVSTAQDYLRFCEMLRRGGEMDGVRLLSRKTIELMTRNHLPDDSDLTQFAQGTFSETPYEGIGFGLGFSVNLGPARTGAAGSSGEYAWGGAASTAFWIDPVESLVVIFMTQLMPSATYDFRAQLRAITCGSIID